MTLMLSEADYVELCHCDEPQHHSQCLALQSETSRWLPSVLGKGCTRSVEVSPGVWLDVIDKEFAQPWALKVPVHEHLVQITIMVSGVVDYDETYPTLGAGRAYFSGSGLSSGYVARYGRSHQLKGINIHIDPDVIAPFLVDQPAMLHQMLIKTDDWKTAWFPKVTPAMQTVAQQLMQCSFQGATQRFYLQAKVFELLALQVDVIEGSLGGSLGEKATGAALKPMTVEAIYRAKEILSNQVENPPSMLELARQVGVCDRTLRRGFRDLFGTTVIGYLNQQRMLKAEQLLRQGGCTVAEVANKVGYAHLGHFSAAFRKQMGISPRECLSTKSVLG
ncbi:helix-turn-helix transcriptional regulator [Leptolyngbya sp. AN02str]|uniref:helix-turn-helix transcriptional regulator n=1 Tax=Leptolyngbya sp. AN02str TaxID=3423363 RepID=UPI003D314711